MAHLAVLLVCLAIATCTDHNKRRPGRGSLASTMTYVSASLVHRDTDLLKQRLVSIPLEKLPEALFEYQIRIPVQPEYSADRAAEPLTVLQYVLKSERRDLVFTVVESIVEAGLEPDRILASLRIVKFLTAKYPKNRSPVHAFLALIPTMDLAELAQTEFTCSSAAMLTHEKKYTLLPYLQEVVDPRRFVYFENLVKKAIDDEQFVMINNADSSSDDSDSFVSVSPPESDSYARVK